MVTRPSVSDRASIRSMPRGGANSPEFIGSQFLSRGSCDHLDLGPRRGRFGEGQLRRPGGEVAPAAGGTLGWVATDTLTVLPRNGHYQRSDFSPRETYTSCMSRVGSPGPAVVPERGAIFSHRGLKIAPRHTTQAARPRLRAPPPLPATAAGGHEQGRGEPVG